MGRAYITPKKKYPKGKGPIYSSKKTKYTDPWKFDDDVYPPREVISTLLKHISVGEFYTLISNKIKEINKEFFYLHLDEESEKTIKSYKDLLNSFKDSKIYQPHICHFCDKCKTPRYIFGRLYILHPHTTKSPQVLNWLESINLHNLDLFIYMDLKEKGYTLFFEVTNYYCSDVCMNCTILQNLP